MVAIGSGGAVDDGGRPVSGGGGTWWLHGRRKQVTCRSDVRGARSISEKKVKIVSRETILEVQRRLSPRLVLTTADSWRGNSPRIAVYSGGARNGAKSDVWS